MGVLGPGLGLILAEGVGPVGGAVAAVDERTGGYLGLMGDAQRIGTHIGNKTHGALAAELHALIQLLGDGHGAAGGHISLREASCWRVEVVKGGDGERCLSARFTLLTEKVRDITSSQMAWVSAWEAGSYFLPFFP